MGAQNQAQAAAAHKAHADMAWKEMAESLGYGTVKAMLHGEYWVRDQTLRDLEGLLGYSDNAVLYRMRREGVPRRPRGWRERDDRYYPDEVRLQVGGA